MLMEGMMKLTDSEFMELQRQAGARNGRADSARHARLILLLADGLTWAEIRAKLDCSDSYISRWSTRFQTDRLAGLFARLQPFGHLVALACWPGRPNASRPMVRRIGP